VARHAKTKAKKTAPADAVVIAPLVEEVAEPQYMLVGPDAAPPIVHVDPPAGDIMVEHLRSELAARDEEIEQLKSAVSGFVTLVEEKDREIVELRAARAGLEHRVRRLQTARYDEFAAFLLHYCGQTDADIKTLMEAAKEFLPEVFEALEQRLAETAPKEEESASPTQPGDQTWDQFAATYRATETPLPEIHPKLIAGMVAWADENGHDVEQIIGAPKEAVEIWVATAKNFRGQTCAGNLQRETTAKIFQRFGDERRHSIAAMASSLNLKEKFLAGVLDMMFRADYRNTISRDPDGKSWKYTIRRPAKEKAA
jgi:hypothetical protein